MEFVATMTELNGDPAAWAAAREAEGWDLVSTGDHYFTDL